MHAPLALLLPLVALAHAAGALHWGLRGSSPDTTLRNRDIAVYERGSGIPNNHKHFYMPKGQCTAFIEKEKLLCKAVIVHKVKWFPPKLLRVATSADRGAPHIRITDKLDRVELRRQPPCRDRLEVYLDTKCLLY